jgi:cytochrome b pre-mRNA-processing protein 3
MLGLFRRKRHERAGFALYTAAVTAARDPWFYTALQVPDTLDGGFDLVGVHVFLIIDRVRNEAPPGPDVAQAVFDAMFADMDFNLREMGVGDMSVGKRMKEMWEAFHGRATVYANAVAAGDDAGLAEALARNVWRGADPPDGAAKLASYVRRLHEGLKAQPLEPFLRGEIDLRAIQPVMA